MSQDAPARPSTTPAAPSKKGGGSGMRQVGSTAAIKVVVMGVSGILGIITSHLIIGHFGTAAYAQYGLLTSFPQLLPFADLGIAAVVINSVAGSEKPSTDEAVRRTLITAFRVLFTAGGVILLAATVLTVFDLWPRLLGDGLLPGGGLTAGLCLAVFSVVIPMTIGQRILIGLRKTTTQVASQTVVAPFMILVIGSFVLLAVPAGNFLSIVSYVANGLVSVICLVIAWRVLSPQVKESLKNVFRPRRYPSVKIMSVAWPMMLQSLILPIAIQSDRVLLSHHSGSEQLAQYNLAAQLFGIVLQTINAAGVALWPIYTRARAQGRVESPYKAVVYFLIGGLAVGGALVAVSPWLVRFVSGGRIVLPTALLIGFLGYIAIQAAKYPLTMYMTDKRGMTFQVVPILIGVPLNLALSWFLITPFGAAGPIIGSLIMVALCQLLPNLWFVERDLRRRRAELAAAAEQAPVTEAEGTSK